MATSESALPATRSAPRAILAAIRPHQWVKNVLVLVPVVLDHRLHDPPC